MAESLIKFLVIIFFIVRDGMFGNDFKKKIFNL